MLRSLSLTSRLTLFFTLLSAAIVLGLGVIFLVASERHFIDLDDIVLQDKQRLVGELLARSSSTQDAQVRLKEALDHHHGLYVLIKDVHGRVFFESDDFNLPDAAALPEPGSTPKSLLWSSRERAYHGLAQWSETNHGESTEMLILVAIDTEHHTHFMAQLQHTLALYAVLATLVSGFAGWFAAHQGMAPLRAMKSRASVVSGQQLNQRMQVEAVPIEMADLANELNHMLDRLQQDFQRLSDFSSDLAHELRTPISNLLTQTQVALSNRRDADTYRDILASNAEEFQRLARMVSDMLFLAKTERGLQLPSKELFSAEQEAQALLDFYEAVAEEKNVRMSLHGSGNILGDRLMFRRAVSNLLSNALRHTKMAGEVCIEISDTENSTQVSVENTGDGIDPKIMPRLFDRFYRADPSRAQPDSDGTGLGLAITRAIVEAHGGKIEVSSAQGRTRFTLEFRKVSLT
ncbi:heavy metal sensor histidine kinase [Rhodoferax sp. BAB1]|uniref:heavy metal sensor histidine kinase n=1 Tax=Rhodoferax sp. BAB1 TaxID=2741720 RepID=UPI001575D9E5|nr:heavy metal sensor histidine kinase [Rhodoferax sp. BAB1]QKO20882.1 heavy metal sensor histidine kinase [Rhodoferax sp. BAB1]